MANYSQLVNDLGKVEGIRSQVFPVIRPGRYKAYPAIIYSPQGGDVVEAVEGSAGYPFIAFEVLGTTFEEVNRVHDEILKHVEFIGSPTLPFVRYEDKVDNGIFHLSFEGTVKP